MVFGEMLNVFKQTVRRLDLVVCSIFKVFIKKNSNKVKETAKDSRLGGHVI